MLTYHAEVSYKLGKVTIKYNPCESTVQPVLQQSTIQRQKYFGAAFVGNHVHHALHPASTHRLSHVEMELLSSHCPNFLREALLVAKRYDRLIAEFAVTAESDISQNSHSQLHDYRAQADREDKIQASSMSSPRTQVVRRSRGKLQHHPTPPLAGAPRTALCCPSDRFGVGLGLLGEQDGESMSSNSCPRRSATPWFAKSIGTRQSRDRQEAPPQCQLCLSSLRRSQVLATDCNK